MTSKALWAGVGVVVAAMAVAGCTSSEGSEIDDEASSVTSPAVTSPEAAAATPTGSPVGQAVMKVLGDGTVTLRYTINGGPERTETDVALPWEKTYDAYDKINSAISVDSGGREVMCTITFDGDMVVAMENKPDPTCSFAYY